MFTVLVLRARGHAPRYVKARTSRGIYRRKDCTLSKSRNCSGTWKEPPDSRSLISSCTGSYKADIVSSRSPERTRSRSRQKSFSLCTLSILQTQHLMGYPTNHFPRLQSLFYPERESMASIGRSGSTSSVTRSPHLTTSPPLRWPMCTDMTIKQDQPLA